MDFSPETQAPQVADTPLPSQTLLEETARPFIGRWQRLVSTTNWEKGRIISEWRRELIATGSPDGSWTDEMWSQMVGGVTPQHVGRLRRVYERFGSVYADYEGLYWSHFHAALDWDDAEMWLEGAVQNTWSVSQLRKHRAETLGHLAADALEDEPAVAPEADEDFLEAHAEPQSASMAAASILEPGVHEFAEPNYDDRGHVSTAHDRGEALEEDDRGDGAVIFAPPSDQGVAPFVRPFEHLAELPDDLGDAFERYKLAILRHKAMDWAEISREDVLASLDALKELALAPAKT